MPSHELSSIQGLEEKHLRALTRHGVTDLRGLVQADPDVIYRAMANLRPRPTRDLIARWQGEAGCMLRETEPDAPDETGPDAAEWQTVASFVVVFSQRRADDSWERQVEAERTEVEPERHTQVWPGWACEPICGWMFGELEQAGGAGSATANGTAGAPAQPAEDHAGAGSAVPGPAEPAPERPALHIDSATIIDVTGRVDVLTAGAVLATAPRALVAPVRVAFTVSGARPETQLRAVTRILRKDGPGRNAWDPVAVPDSGAVEFDLSGVPAGEHDLDLIAWALDATAKPVSIILPTMTIRSG
jgi:hypothetical protein